MITAIMASYSDGVLGDRQIDIAGCEQESDKRRFKGDPHDLIFSMREQICKISIQIHHRLEPLDRSRAALPKPSP